jgi:hypothetical protein
MVFMTIQRLILPAFAGFLVTCFAAAASAQIDRPGNHPRYGVELEPHLVVQWAHEPWWDDDGIGLGLRASIPLLEDGPVRTINNSMAIGFGLDWAHFDDACGPAFNDGPFDDDCSADDFWLPVVVQWNFFFSDLISAFPELGLGIQHSRWDGYWCGRGNDRYLCRDGDASDTDVHLLFWLGVRFHLSQEIAITLRVGTPSLLLGVSFFL